ncbi:MAG: HNH endonuclease, partial [bacterium]|nr:HNH endonuclease [bacterium]
MSTNFVFVLDTDRRPLSPCHPARARALLKQGKAAVLRRFPFTIVLTRSVPDANPKPCQVKLDPGSKTTGVAIVQGSRVIWAAEILHRGGMIKKKLADRSARRRNRRTRRCYRKPSYRTKAQIRNAKATYKRKRAKGWLPPSLRHRIETTLTWVTRFIRFAPIGELTQELVRFDMQRMDNAEIKGVEYQQGTLAGLDVKEYLLQKWGRKCAYCGADDKPLEVEHIEPRSGKGTDRVSNLTLACT